MKRNKLLMASILLLLSLFSSTFENTIVAHAATRPTGPQAPSIPINLMKGIKPGAYKVSLQRKLALRGRGKILHPLTCSFACAPAWRLTEYPDLVGEPPANGSDINGKGYTDYYMLYLCGPGASTEVLRFWVNTDTMGKQTYDDGTGQGPLTWNNDNERSYLMYIALRSMPASFSAVGGSPGEETYGSSPNNSYTSFADLANVLNWEASGHTSSSNYQQYGNGFYTVVGSGNLNLDILQSDAADDIYTFGVPLVASVKARDLPDWNNKNSAATHFIAIIGYDNTNNTFTYTETCGSGCDTQGFGYYYIGQQQLLNAIYDAGGNGGIVW